MRLTTDYAVGVLKRIADGQPPDGKEQWPHTVRQACPYIKYLENEDDLASDQGLPGSDQEEVALPMLEDG